MIRFPIPIVAGGLCAALLVAGEVRAQSPIVTLFDVRETVISPDADGRADSTRVRYTLSASATTLSLIVYEADSITPVATLRPPGPEASGGPRSFYWNGKRSNGSLAPEGAYVVTLHARGESNPDSVKSLPIFLDVTAPTVQILSALPNPYAPGAPGSTASVNFSFVVTNASPTFPGRVPDELRSAFTTPSGALTPTSLTTTPPFNGHNGNYVLSWNATAEPNVPPEGEFTMTLTLNDVAGYTATSMVHFDVDTRPPVVKATSLPENISVAEVPESLDGFAFDLHGVDSLAVRYGDNRPYQLVTSTVLVNDTLYFAVPLADSFPAEGAFFVEFRATDIFDRATTYAFNFRYDTSAPLAPTLDPAPATWKASRYPLTGHANDEGDGGSFVRIYRNGALVDSASTLVFDDFAIDVALDPGRNDIYAVLRDGAFNVSPRSNTLAITFDTGAGLFGHVPFRPGDSFDVNASRTASRCTVRLFDMTGQIVRVLEDDSARQYYAIAWDGVNGSGVGVKKGPLVVVASVDYSDGSRDIFREVFLYDPHAQ